LKYLLI